MLVKRTSQFTGVEHEREIAVTEGQLAAWRAGDLIQDAMPHLSDADREFLMTGVTPEEWDAVFGGEEDDPEYPDPAERYEDLHREERDEERRYDEYLDDFDHPEDED